MNIKKWLSIKTWWTLPDRLLETKGTFLGEKPDKVVYRFNIGRSVCGLVLAVYVAFAYSRFTGPFQELFTSRGNSSAEVIIALNLAVGLLVTTVLGFMVFVPCLFVFAALIIPLTRSEQRLAVLRRLAIPLITVALFAALLVLITKIEDLLNVLTNWIEISYYNADPATLSGLGPLLLVLVEALALLALYLIVVVWELKTIYLAAANLFRADDAHPLLAPVATTVVSWTIAGIVWLTSAPPGLPTRLNWLLTFSGPAGISAINIWACWRLWRKHRDILFRNGPIQPGESMAYSAASPLAAGAAKSRREATVVSAILAGLGPLIAILVVFGPFSASLATLGGYLSPNSGPGSLGWTFTTEGKIYSSPAVVGGAVYIGSEDGKVYALDAATGNLRWTFTTGGPIRSSPAVVGGAVYIGSGFNPSSYNGSTVNGKVYALDAATGRLRWTFNSKAAVDSSPTMVGGAVYIGGQDGKVYALDAATGNLRWAYKTGSSIYSSPAVAGGFVYIGSDDRKVYALDATTGRLRWSYITGSLVDSSPAVVGGVVYIGGVDGKMYALDAATGNLRWTSKTGAPIYSSPAVVGGAVYIGSEDGKVYALDAATGRLRWAYKTGHSVDSSPTVFSGVVYIGSGDGRVYALNATTGRLHWSYGTGNYVKSSLVVVDGVIYVGSTDNVLYALTVAG